VPPSGGPAAPPPPPPTPTFVATGLVSGDGQPLENAKVEVGSYLAGASTDASGRYRVELFNALPVGALVSAYHDRFPFQPCAVSAALIPSGTADLTADVSLTSAKGYSAAAIRIVSGARRVFGTVYALAPDGTKGPVADARVAWESSWEEWKAWSATDSTGRFALCGLPIDRDLSIYSERSPGNAWASIPRGTGDVEIEMILNPTE
jgi:hypothetical protein